MDLGFPLLQNAQPRYFRAGSLSAGLDRLHPLAQWTSRSPIENIPTLAPDRCSDFGGAVRLAGAAVLGQIKHPRPRFDWHDRH
jgi:hypothetical protein